MSTLIQSEQERRAKERRNGGSNLRVQTPTQAQDPVVAPSNLPAPAQESGSASDFSVGDPQPRQQQAAPTPRRRPDGLPDLVTSQTIQPVQRMAAADKPGGLDYKAQGRGDWWRDRVRENLTDKDGDMPSLSVMLGSALSRHTSQIKSSPLLPTSLRTLLRLTFAIPTTGINADVVG